MISYALLEEDEPVRPRVSRAPVLLKKEGTECNYIVFFFIIGVILIALSDTLKR